MGSDFYSNMLQTIANYRLGQRTLDQAAEKQSYDMQKEANARRREKDILQALSSSFSAPDTSTKQPVVGSPGTGKAVPSGNSIEALNARAQDRGGSVVYSKDAKGGIVVSQAPSAPLASSVPSNPSNPAAPRGFSFPAAVADINSSTGLDRANKFYSFQGQAGAEIALQEADIVNGVRRKFRVDSLQANLDNAQRALASIANPPASALNLVTGLRDQLQRAESAAQREQAVAIATNPALNSLKNSVAAFTKQEEVNIANDSADLRKTAEMAAQVQALYGGKLLTLAKSFNMGSASPEELNRSAAVLIKNPKNVAALDAASSGDTDGLIGLSTAGNTAARALLIEAQVSAKNGDNIHLDPERVKSIRLQAANDVATIETLTKDKAAFKSVFMEQAPAMGLSRTDKDSLTTALAPYIGTVTGKDALAQQTEARTNFAKKLLSFASKQKLYSDMGQLSDSGDMKAGHGSLGQAYVKAQKAFPGIPVTKDALIQQIVNMDNPRDKATALDALQAKIVGAAKASSEYPIGGFYDTLAIQRDIQETESNGIISRILNAASSHLGGAITVGTLAGMGTTYVTKNPLAGLYAGLGTAVAYDAVGTLGTMYNEQPTPNE